MLAAGTVSGMAQLIVGHPMDTLKVRLQTNQRGYFNGTLSDVVTKTIRHEGVLAFYKGVLPPLLTTSITNAWLFTIRGWMGRIVQPDPHIPLTLGQIVLASQMTAPLYTLLVNPVEMVKARMQFNVKARLPLPRVLRDTIRQEGLLSLWKGYIPCTLTRMLGLPFYFGGFELTKRALTPSGQRNASIPSLMLAGSVAGVAFWFPAFVTDHVKNRIQVSRAPNPGFRGLYSGFTPAIYRAIPANAIVFMVYDRVISTLRDQGHWDEEVAD